MFRFGLCQEVVRRSMLTFQQKAQAKDRRTKGVIWCARYSRSSCASASGARRQKAVAEGRRADQINESSWPGRGASPAKIETDHIIPTGEGGSDSIDNAIPVCFECHAEIHSYNDKHPRGRRFRADELRAHKEQWLKICVSRPDVLVNTARNADVGPLQALIDELDFNSVVADHSDGPQAVGCAFHDEQFHRAIREGSIATLNDTLKQTILEAYRAIGHANHMIAATTNNVRVEEKNTAMFAVRHTKSTVVAARDALLGFLGSEK